MKIGSLVFATDQGLGYLAKDFYDNGILSDVIIVHHGSRKNHPDWYPQSTILSAQQLKNEYTKKFIRDMDMMLFFETPFDWDLIDYCREANTTSVLMPMHECMPDPLPSQPDYFLYPSLLEEKIYGQDRGKFIPVPVTMTWRRRVIANTFVHNAGNGGLLGRNGTQELLEAIPLVKSPAKFLIRSQVPIESNPIWNKAVENKSIEFRVGQANFKTLYDEGDIFIFPEKFNGLSLPLQEAFASGMLVMTTDRFPNNTWLPTLPLIPVSGNRKNRVSPRCREFDEAIISPLMIAEMIDRWYGQNISSLSGKGLNYLIHNSWQWLKSDYQRTLESWKHEKSNNPVC